MNASLKTISAISHSQQLQNRCLGKGRALPKGPRNSVEPINWFSILTSTTLANKIRRWKFCHSITNDTSHPKNVMTPKWAATVSQRSMSKVNNNKPRFIKYKPLKKKCNIIRIQLSWRPRNSVRIGSEIFD